MAPPNTHFLLPEAVGGEWAVNAAWWRRVASLLERKHQTLIIGVKQARENSQRYLNMLTTLGKGRGVEFIGRVPVPLGMWTPHRLDGAQAFWWDTGVSKLNGKKIAALICYEQLLIWPIMISMSQNPELLIGAANDWWARGTSIPQIQRQVVTAWGRLFGVPIVYAANL